MDVNMGGHHAQMCLLVYTIIFWFTGLVFVFLSLWTLLDPQRNYVLDLVDFSEDVPLLRGATYLALITGIVTVIVGFIGCCGAVKKSQCMITAFTICLLVLFFADATVACLALFYRSKFLDDKLNVHLTTLTHDRYSRLYWVTPLIDTIQYYQQCCGVSGPYDYFDSFWYRTNTERGTISFVPQSCCKQMQEARAWSIRPIDPLCTTYDYYTSSFNNSVNVQGCHGILLDRLTAQTIVFVSIGFLFAAIQLVGIYIALSLSRHVHTFYHITI